MSDEDGQERVAIACLLSPFKLRSERESPSFPQG
jgi:hypothetical protein